MEQERLSFLALHFLPGIGDQLTKQLIGYCGSAEQVFKTSKGRLLKIPGIGEVAADAIINGNTFAQAEDELLRARKSNTEILFFTDKKYPHRLKQVEDAPSVLYFNGNVNLNLAKSVAIVGTRMATDYGREMVEKIIQDLKVHEPLIVSGLAYGIDIQAHKQALKFQLPTIGVMGSGMDIIYPAAHRDTAKKMTEQGGLLTENHFGVKPDAHHFPARNRIIAGMCDVLIVVEAAEKGGALITAEIANSYNKDIFAVPGNIGQVHSEGCNKLIKTNKAHLLTSVKDIEYIMNWNSDSRQAGGTTLSLFEESALLTPEERSVFQTLEKGAVMLDDISIRTGIPLGQLASILLNLEFGGKVISLPGKIYKLSRR
jgi:DNA processing protein